MHIIEWISTVANRSREVLFAPITLLLPSTCHSFSLSILHIMFLFPFNLPVFEKPSVCRKPLYKLYKLYVKIRRERKTTRALRRKGKVGSIRYKFEASKPSLMLLFTELVFFSCF